MRDLERWIALADSYGTDFGEVIPPTNVTAYAGRIMSLLSDAQEGLERGIIEPTNERINAAKVMLSRMAEANDPRIGG